MVDCSQPAAGNHYDFAAQSCDQIPHRKPLTEGHQQTADPFDEQALATAGYAFDSPKDVLQADGAMTSSGSNQRGEGLSKKERANLVERQLAVLNCAQEFRVGSAATAKRFHRQRVAAALPQVVEEQPGQQCFANAGVGPSNEDDAWRTGLVHSGELTTDEAG